MAYFKSGDHRLAYTVYGDGPRTTVLLPGLLFSQRMHVPLARALSDRGNRVVTLDLLGHGKSDRPQDMRVYSMDQFAEQTLALLDHLEIDQAVVGGTSLGANVTLSVAARAPDRLRGMIVEMPVLDNALLWSALAFTPLLVALTFGEPAMRFLSRGARAVPRGVLAHYGNVVLDVVRQDPGPGGAVLQGLFFGRVAPDRTERRTFRTPALVLGHRRDPVHPFSDAGQLTEELSHGRLVEADSLVELRLKPERLTNEIASFLDEVWAPPRRARTTRRAGKRPRGAATSAGKVRAR